MLAEGARPELMLRELAVAELTTWEAQMLMFGCILVYLKYWTLNLMPLMVYPEVL